MLLTVTQTTTNARIVDLTTDGSLTGAVNGANTVYTTSQDFTPGSEIVFFNGVRQIEGVGCDYVRSE